MNSTHWSLVTWMADWLTFKEFSHIYSYQTADSYCVAIQLRPPYEGGWLDHGRCSDGAWTIWKHFSGMMKFSRYSQEPQKQTVYSAEIQNVLNLHAKTTNCCGYNACTWMKKYPRFLIVTVQHLWCWRQKHQRLSTQCCHLPAQGGGTRQIHKITSEWDSRKGALNLTC